MAISATFYSFSKRKNSTKQPTGSGDSYSVTLKSGTSLLSPTLLLNIASRPSYNYLSFEGRYYFVTDIVSVRNDLWEISCTVDALATWKSEISSTPVNVLYATGGRDDIIDSRIPVTEGITVSSSLSAITGDFTGFTPDTMGIAIVSITGIGSFGNYLMDTEAHVRDLMKNVNVWAATDMTDILTALKQLATGGNIGQNLKSAICLPIILSNTSNFGSASQLYLGRYPCADGVGNAIYGYPVIDPIMNATSEVDIPWQYTDWRRNSPYTKLYLYVPLIGCISIPSNEVVTETKLIVLYSLNLLSGDVAIEIKAKTSGRILATGSANIAMSTPYGSSNISAGKIVSSIGVGVASVASVALGVATGGAGTVALAGGLSASAAGLLSALGGETAGGGGLGGSAVTGLDLGVQCYTVSKTLTDNQTNLDSIIGKPVMKKTTVGNYNGFVQTDGMCVSGAMTDSEHDIINAACDRGIYYE